MVGGNGEDDNDGDNGEVDDGGGSSCRCRVDTPDGLAQMVIVEVMVIAVNSAVDVKKTTKMIKVVVAVVMVMMMMTITMVLTVDAKKITTKSNDR